MLEKIIDLDKKALIFFNSFGSENFDSLWLIITKQIYWTPFFLLVSYLLLKKIGLKNVLITIIFVAFLILLCDQTCNLFKNSIQRLRPCNDPEINTIIRIVKTSSSFSFFSGHATNSMASTVFVFLLFKKYYKNGIYLFLFPLIFAYSRIYLGLHFPTDILTGYLVGATFGLLFHEIFVWFQKKHQLGL